MLLILVVFMLRFPGFPPFSNAAAPEPYGLLQFIQILYNVTSKQATGNLPPTSHITVLCRSFQSCTVLILYIHPVIVSELLLRTTWSVWSAISIAT